MQDKLLIRQFPFGPHLPPQHCSEYPFIEKRHFFKTLQEQNLLQHKVNKIRGLSLRNLITIQFAQQAQQWINIFYQHIPHTLESLIDQSHLQTLKLLHRQFIELSIGLAKAGITTPFNPAHCGALVQNGEAILKYYLPPEDVQITLNREEIERCVEIFSSQAMNFLKTITDNKRRRTPTNSSSQFLLLNRSSDVKVKEKNQGCRLSESKVSTNSMQKNTYKEQKVAQMRKLSNLSRQLSQISARHNSKKTHSYQGSLSDFKHSVQTLTTSDSTVRLSGNNSLPKCHPAFQSQQSLIMTSIKSRSKRAQKQLQQVKERMQGYKKLYNFLKNLKRN